MNKQAFRFILCIIALSLSGCKPIEFPKIDRHPEATDPGRDSLIILPTYNPSSSVLWQVDLRSCDLSGLDMRQSLDDLMYADFDTLTMWPTTDKIPPEFDWQRMMELGKNPGLGIRGLHAMGITGRGVSIAIIDTPLLVDHQEFADPIQLYEEINVDPGTDGSMHGTAVASVAVGKTSGVSPEADLYYIGVWASDIDTKNQLMSINYSHHAEAVRRIMQINQQLPEGRRIRVIVLDHNYWPGQNGYDEIMAAINKAKAEGILVVSGILEETFGFKFYELGRMPLADPEQFESYEPGIGWPKDIDVGQQFSDVLLVPMDSRTTASPAGTSEYVFYRKGGWSSIPYIAGIYVLAIQAKPTLTPDEFWTIAMKTGQTIELEYDGKSIPFGPILDPVALIETLQAE